MSSQSEDSKREQESKASGRVRDTPTKCNLNTEFDKPECSHNGVERRPRKGEVISPRKDHVRREWTEERDPRHDLECKKERDLGEQLKMQQRQREFEKEQHEERRRWEGAYATREREGIYGYTPHYPNERRGFYVRKAR